MIKLAVFLSAYQAANAVYQGFISLYLRGRGLNNGQIGIVMGAVPLLSAFTLPCWGILGDQTGRFSMVLRIMALLSAGALLLFPAGNGFMWMLTVNSLFAVSFTAMQPMADAAVLSALHQDNRFGKIRLCACVCYAAVSFTTGCLLKGKTHLMIAFGVGFLLLTACASFFLPRKSGSNRCVSKAGRVRDVLKAPGLLKLLTMTGILQITMGYFYSFFPLKFLSLPGSHEGYLGVCYLLSSAGEILLLICFDKLFLSMGSGRLMLTGALMLSVRWLILGVSENLPIVMSSQVFSGWGVAAVTVTLAKEVSRLAPKELGARGQTVCSAISYALARVVGNMAGGQIAEHMGIQAGFVLMSVVCVCVFFVFSVSFLKHSVSQKEPPVP